MQKVLQEVSPETKSSLEEILPRIVGNTGLHTKWLNTLSYMEHIGATKIARTQSGPSATYTSLKHAAEEARHAFFLKRLCHKLDTQACPDYHTDYLLAPHSSRAYLYLLDARVSRKCKEAGLSGKKLHDLAYLLVTLAIELRADELYPVYEEFLKPFARSFSVQGIINEEVGHLEEMQEALSAYPAPLQDLQHFAIACENHLYEDWLTELQKEVAAFK